MYDVGKKTVSKLDGTLSAAFVKAAEENDTTPSGDDSTGKNISVTKQLETEASQPEWKPI